MAADPLPATLSFLTDAAHLLVSASPETSAHLMSQRNALMFNNDLNQSDVQRQHVCGCCGHIMIAGWGDVLKMDSIKTARNKRRAGGKQKDKQKAKVPLKGGCPRLPKRRPGHISRSTSMNAGVAGVAGVAGATSTSMSISTPASAVTAASRAASAPVVGASSNESTKVSANASSKKRAKTRKQGLQALLQQSSSSKSQAGLGLSLADFMQH
ncbi:hypothetical protein GQX73_g6184 [Xylaria multiplex]|uniref:Uncharacterized protein n=1 Tax=Xylaria multiplex TaxID=323545 RepID=A0A7C8MSN7_9PEZI|nr:hypothetical protein GQX73_g6184 [Xylaria multiplex]